MVPRSDRPTTDVVVILFALTVAVILVVVAVGMAVSAARGEDVGAFGEVIVGVLTSLTGAIFGYLAGRGSRHQDLP